MKNETTYTDNQWEVYYFFKNNVLNPSYHLCDKITQRALANALFDAGREPVEFISEEAQKLKDEKGHKYVPCYEHFRGRTQSAKDITRAFLTGKSQSFIMKLIKSRMRGHYTTSEENVKLKKFDHLPWRKAYAEAGIKLIPWEPKPVRKFDYIIEGKTYESISEVAEKYGITTDGVVYRCKSDSERFTDWTRETIDE